MRRALLLVAVGVVLADSAIVTLALPDILRDLGTDVGQVAWVLIAFNLVLALAAVPAARFCPPSWCAGGLVVFAAASAACALAPSLTVLIVARVVQALGGAVVLVTSLERLGSVRAWAAAGVAGAALGPVAGGLLTDALSWPSIFAVQVPLVLAAAWAVGAVPTAPNAHVGGRDRPHLAANLALALLSAALTAALFLLVLMLVEAWQRSPAVAALTVTVVPVAAFAARPLAKATPRAEAVAGAVLLAGGLTALALPPSASLGWTIAPQVLIGLGLGLTIESLTDVAVRERLPQAVHGGWTIAARHAGVVLGLAILTPIFTADLRHAETPAKEAIASLVLDAPVPATTKLKLADGLSSRLASESGRIPDLHPAFAHLDVPPLQAIATAHLERRLDDQLRRAATRAFRAGFLVAALLALLALVPLAVLRDTGRRSVGAATALALIAIGGVAGVLGVARAEGAGDYVPKRPANPCTRPHDQPVPADLEPLAERLVLTGFDEAACARGISRERFLLGLTPRDAEPLRAGLQRAAAELRLPKVSALLPQIIDGTDLPGLAKTVIKAVPDAVVDRLLPTEELLARSLKDVDLRAVIANPADAQQQLEDVVINAAGDQAIASLKDLLP